MSLVLLMVRFYNSTTPFTRRKPQSKKHKTWDGDAYVTVQGGMLVLVSERGKM